MPTGSNGIWQRVGVGLLIALAAGGASFVAGSVRTETTVDALQRELMEIEARFERFSTRSEDAADRLTTSLIRLEARVNALPPGDLLLRVSQLEEAVKKDEQSLSKIREQMLERTRDRYFRAEAEQDFADVRIRLRRLESQIYGEISNPLHSRPGSGELP